MGESEFIQFLEYSIYKPVTESEYIRNMMYLELIAGHEVKTIFGINITKDNIREIVKQVMLADGNITNINYAKLKFIIER